LGSCVCPAGTYKDSNYICQTCDETCLTCNGGTSSDCATCPVGLTLQASGECTCPAGTSYDSSSKSCIGCGSLCASCTGSTCGGCVNNLQLNAQGGCECPTGKYLDSLLDTCVSCPGNCDSCSGLLGTTCNKCSDGFIQYLWTCYAGCTSSEYFNILALGCSDCNDACETCYDSSDSSCKSCKSGVLVLGSCVCPAGTYKDSSYICQTCDATCLTCDGPLGTDCLTCRSDMTLSSNNECFCASGKYFEASVKTCRYCDSSCETCSGSASNQCVSCRNNLEKNTQGVCECPTGTYLDTTTTTCVTCPGNCGSCSGLLGTICNSCVDGYIYYQGVCYPECTSSSDYFNVVSLGCEACDDSCLTCSGAGPSNCASCLSGDLIFGVCTCPTESYKDSGYECQTCDDSCLSCSGPLRTDCTDCRSGGFVSGEGTCECPAGFYQDANYECQSCDNSCSTCDGPLGTDCMDCKSGYTMENGVCVKNSNSLTCSTGCSTCVGTAKNQCMTCLPEYIFLENIDNARGSCIQACPMFYYETTSSSRSRICSEKQRINNLIAYGNNGDVTKVIIHTGANLKNKFAKIKEEMNVVLRFRDDQPPIDYTVKIGLSSSSTDIVIDLDFNGHLLPRNYLYISYGDYRGDDSTSFYLANNPQQVTLQEYYKYSTATQKLINGTSTANSVISQANQVFSWVSSGIIRSLHAMRSELVEDMMGYFLYINTDLPPNFVQFLQDRDQSPMDTLNEKLNVIFHDDSVNDITGSVNNRTRSLQGSVRDSNDNALDIYLETRSFWGNFGDKIPFFLIIFGLLGFVEIARRMLPTREQLRKKKLGYYIRGFLDYISIALRWNFILNELIGAYLDLLFASLVQISSKTKRENSSLQFEYAVAVFALLFCFFAVIGIFILTKRIYKTAQKVEPEEKSAEKEKEEAKETTSHQESTPHTPEKEFLKRFEFMSEDFETEYLINLIYPFLMILRSFGYIFALVFGQGSAVLQVVYLVISTLIIIGYLSYFRPFEGKYQLFITLAYEVMLFIACVVLLALTIYNKSNLADINTRTNFGFVLCVASLVIMALNITNMVVEIAEMREYLKYFKRSKTMNKIAPLGSPTTRARLKSGEYESDLESIVGSSSNTMDLTTKKLELSPSPSPQKIVPVKSLETIHEELNTKREGLTPDGGESGQIYLNFSSLKSKPDLGSTSRKLDSMEFTLTNTSPFASKIGHFLVNKEPILIRDQSSSPTDKSERTPVFMPIKSHLLFEKMNKQRLNSSRGGASSRNELLFERNTSRITKGSHLINGTLDDIDGHMGSLSHDEEDLLKSKFSFNNFTPKDGSYWQKSMYSPKDFLENHNGENKTKRESRYNFPIEEKEGNMMTYTTGEAGRKSKTIEETKEDCPLPNTIIVYNEEEEVVDREREGSKNNRQDEDGDKLGVEVNRRGGGWFAEKSIDKSLKVEGNEERPFSVAIFRALDPEEGNEKKEKSFS